MFLKFEKKKDASGNPRTYVSIVEGYRDVNNVSRHRRIKSYGYLEQYEDQDAFLAMVNKDLAKFEKEADNTISFSFTDTENKNNSEFNRIYNYGYRYLETIYDALNIDKYLNDYQKRLDRKIKYKFKEIFKFLVIQRILRPDSKRATIQEINKFYKMNLNFSLDDVYRFQTILSNVFDDLQNHLKLETDRLIKRDFSKVYYDITNYYFEIDFNDLIDNYRHKGVSKEHRLDPIIGFSLFMDSNGLPIKCNIFNGNALESITLIPEMNKIKKSFNINRTIVVADKGLNSSKNIAEIITNGDGYIFSQIIRGRKGKRYHEHILNDDGYIKEFNEEGELIYKYKLFEEDFEIIINGRPNIHKRKVLIYYNLKDDLIAKKKRFEKISKAIKSLRNNAYDIDHAYSKYINKELFDKKTGEIIEGYKLSKTINHDKIAEEEKFDGYFAIVTNELNLNHQELREGYHKLSEIEDMFKVTKTNLLFRPVFHYKKENIKSHFLICYTALLIIRLLQAKLKRDGINLSVERIVNVLNSMNMEIIKDVVHLHHIGGRLDYKEYIKDKNTNFNNVFSGSDQIEKDHKLLNISFNVNFDYAYVKIEKFNRYLKQLHFHTTTA